MKHVCQAMRFVVLRHLDLKLDEGVEGDPEVCERIFEMTPSKVIQKSICLRNTHWLPNLVGRPLTSL